MFELITSGEAVVCTNIDELVSSVQTYRGHSIVIDDLRPEGRLHHLDISESGGCSESFASRRIVDIRLLLAIPGRPVYP